MSTGHKSPTERYEELEKYGKWIPSVSPKVDPLKPPTWFDEEKFKRSQYLAKKYFVPLFVSKTIGAIFIAQIPCVAEPLLATGSCENVSKVFRRTLSTLCRLKSWYETDPFDPSSEAHKSIGYVRGMHLKVGNWMRATDPDRKVDEGIWMNQYDMAVNLWSLISVAVIWPTECGLHACLVSKNDLDAICHFWAVVCHCLCVEDRFNICLRNYDECRELSELFWFKLYKPALVSAPPMKEKYGLELAIGWMDGLKDGGFGPTFSWAPVAQYWYRVAKIPYWHHIKLRTLLDYVVYYSSVFVFEVLMRFSITHWLVSTYARWLVDLNGRRRNQLEQQVHVKHPSEKFPALCPFDDVERNKVTLSKILQM